MDNIQGSVPEAPSQGQAPAQTQVPNGDMGSVSTPGDAVVGATTPPASEAGQGFQIPEKFQGKSSEDIAKAYVELESHNKKVEMERAELEKLFVSEPQTAAAPEPQSSTQLNADSAEEPIQALVRELSPRLQAEVGKLLSPALAKMEVRDMVDRYGSSFVALAPEVKKLRESNPNLTLESAYKIVSFDSIQRTARQEGVAQATKSQEQAQKAQLESSRPSGYRPASIEDAVNDKNVSSADIADALGPEYAAFAETSRRRRTKN